ncbi:MULTISPECIES: ABC transporter permease [unclassified Curtobacterium]|uniref:ABC transporter permease n=1 Tax=unclassified Curtobacterium TaxID=257496 RepID=UPI000DA8A55B|nr:MULTISPECIES: ABC transporter permease [unclassified Curtobacterium]PZE29935.1 ABC transporter permease [Curtobacterium sp. MCBD17_028]PZE74483.1 ABC transporter permease [Curtobacterium sp. MCBD17_019]PZF60986.1 ABC transporter permease [Curtobacterium sp. MCBD17_034]PZF66284.1 ABC transporter permease [Curtobacterium sp. MCBD17_013]PZM40336.1 ABC transporter permease [Curtobacterium sp. MCBD17_031]
MSDVALLDRREAWWKRLPIVEQLRRSVGWQRAMLVTGVVICALFLLVALFAPLIAPYGFAQLQDGAGHPFPRTGAPSSTHVWGTTVGGFDVFSRVVFGARTAVLVVVVAVVISIVVGVLLGMVSGYIGGWLDRVLVVVADAVYAFPSLLLAIVVSIVISGGQSSYAGGIVSAGISITVVYVPQYFRVIRAEAVRLKGEAFVESARVVGTNPWRIMTRHVLRNATRSLPLILTLNASDAILTLASLGFLGFGIGPTAGSEWGYDLNRALSDTASGIWWTGVYPGIAIVLLVLGVTFIGESLNDISDPRLRARRRAKQRVTERPVPAAATEGAGA